MWCLNWAVKWNQISLNAHWNTLQVWMLVKNQFISCCMYCIVFWLWCSYTIHITSYEMTWGNKFTDHEVIHSHLFQRQHHRKLFQQLPLIAHQFWLRFFRSVCRNMNRNKGVSWKINRYFCRLWCIYCTLLTQQWWEFFLRLDLVQQWFHKLVKYYTKGT